MVTFLMLIVGIVKNQKFWWWGNILKIKSWDTIKNNMLICIEHHIWYMIVD